ncbi:MAG: DUF3501 family protein [Alphaproteobacteria bacterium]|nr:DUF3501 family protein [Alphaproteobacteria bacterium]
MAKKQITAADILPLEAYGSQRKQHRASMVDMKKSRRLAVGPHATFHFENFDTMLYQVHEMLWTEKGGAEQLKDELAAYNPLVPNGAELVATFMLEYEDPDRRAQALLGLGGIEETISLQIAEQRIAASWEQEVERTTPDGKTSSIHFLHFSMSPEARRLFKTPGAKAVLAVEHPNYAHMAVIPEHVRAALAGDLE